MVHGSRGPPARQEDDEHGDHEQGTRHQVLRDGRNGLMDEFGAIVDFHDPHAACSVILFKESRHRWCKDTTPHSVFTNDQCGLNFLLRQHRRHFHTDKSAPYHHCLFGSCSSRTYVLGILRGTKIENIEEFVSGAIELSRPGTCSQ